MCDNGQSIMILGIFNIIFKKSFCLTVINNSCAAVKDIKKKKLG